MNGEQYREYAYWYYGVKSLEMWLWHTITLFVKYLWAFKFYLLNCQTNVLFNKPCILLDDDLTCVSTRQWHALYVCALIQIDAGLFDKCTVFCIWLQQFVLFSTGWSRIESFSSLDGILVNYKLPSPVFHPLSPTVVDAKTRVFGPGVQHTKDDTTTSTLWLQEIL